MAKASGSLGTRDAPRVGGFPVVGIGCSAGGLGAAEKFLAAVPAESGMAYVVVQHLDPNRSSILAELLQHVTVMTVREAGDGMAVAPNSVYVIPPNKDLSILHGELHLLDPPEQRGLRLPIDFFLRSLAEDRQEGAIGIVLSGMGEDGVAGLAAIQEKAGLTLAQEPQSAQSDSMPRAAIQAGVADITALPEDMPALIGAYLQHPVQVVRGDSSPAPAIQAELNRIIILLRNHGGNDFSLYKANTLARRVERRIALHHISSVAKYVGYLSDNPAEVDLLFRELLIGVTEFFRDPSMWEYLSLTAIPALLARNGNGKTLRAWVSACSTGEEAYSLAIIFREALDRTQSGGHFKVQIYASDLDSEAIAKARRGYYPGTAAASISPERLARYFTADGDGFHIRKEIREMVVFAPQNIISDPPFTKLDILCCRNLLIYFRPELQAKMLPLFSYALNPGGLLVLGNSEGIGAFSSLFAPVGAKTQVFRRLDRSLPPAELVLPGKAAGRGEPPDHGGPRAEPVKSIGMLTDQLIQQNYAPAAVLISGDGDLLYISGHVGTYLEPAAGKVNLNVHAMAREGLREVLPGLIRRALAQATPARCDGLEVSVNGRTQAVNIIVQRIATPEALRGRLLVVFQDTVRPPSGRKGHKAAAIATHAALVQELQETREALETMRGDMQTSLEELTSGNEELQSTNEELMTSKEEMQSMNEELQTVIAERQSKVDGMVSVQNDMENLLNSTEIATIFLDGERNVRRYTSYATKVFRLIPTDVGRPLSDVVCSLDYSQLDHDIEGVLATLTFLEREAATGDGRHYRVRIMPYRTQDDVVDGVVITFTEIRRLDANSK